MMKAGTKIVPVVISLVVGYFVFIKLPFLFFRQTLKDVRKMHPEEDNLPKFPEEAKVMRLEDKIRRDAEELKKEQAKAKKEEPKKEERRKEERKQEAKQERKQEPPKKPAPAASSAPSAESVFNLRPGEKLTKEELKARYHELLKQSHPDRVASMGPEFKKLAEKKTKELNDAYEKLKKAS
jgi:DnaJ-domain-containing protein 1